MFSASNIQTLPSKGTGGPATGSLDGDHTGEGGGVRVTAPPVIEKKKVCKVWPFDFVAKKKIFLIRQEVSNDNIKLDYHQNLFDSDFEVYFHILCLQNQIDRLYVTYGCDH